MKKENMKSSKSSYKANASSNTKKGGCCCGSSKDMEIDEVDVSVEQ